MSIPSPYSPLAFHWNVYAQDPYDSTIHHLVKRTPYELDAWIFARRIGRGFIQRGRKGPTTPFEYGYLNPIDDYSGANR